MFPGFCKKQKICQNGVYSLSLVVPTSVSFVSFCNFQLTTSYNPGFGTAGEIHANALAPMLCFVLRKFHVREGQNVRDQITSAGMISLRSMRPIYC